MATADGRDGVANTCDAVFVDVPMRKKRTIDAITRTLPIAMTCFFGFVR
jgi:hypothetical protein